MRIITAHLLAAHSLIAFAAAKEAAAAPPAPEAPAAPAAPVAAAKPGKLPPPTITAIAAAGAIARPQKKTTGRRGSNVYPFDDLVVDGSFGVIGRTAKSLASTISSANRRSKVQATNEDGTPKFTVNETKDAAGNVIKTERVAVMVAGKVFEVHDVDPKTDPAGASARVWRIA